MEFIARKSNYILEDIQRNWSSWNFGQEGITANWEDIDNAMNNAIEFDTEFSISGFDLWGDDIKNADIRELYTGYWVLVDNVNTGGGLSCIDLDCEDLDTAIETATKRSDYFGDGVSFDAAEYKLVKTINDIHIFQYAS